MWLGGDIDRGRLYKHRFKEGELVEAPVRDDTGKAQGFILLRALSHDSTAGDGHLFSAEFLACSDSHYRWWMTEGEGKRRAKRGLYHACEGNAQDCKFTKGRYPLVHLEKFRTIRSKELQNRVPDWAFKGQARKDIEAFDLKMQSDKLEGEDSVPLPWAQAEEAEEGPDESSDASGSSDQAIGEKIQKVRDQLKKLEKQQAKAKKKKKKGKGEAKVAKTKEKKKPKDKTKDRKRRPSPSTEESKHRGRSTKRKKRRSESTEGGRRRARRDKEGSKRRKKVMPSDSSEEAPEAGLFEKTGHEEDYHDPIPKKGDRGPFGSGLPVEFDGADSSDSDRSSVFRSAPPQPVKSGQQALITYSHRRPGRLAARLLMKMKSEVALGSGGAMEGSQEKTPAIAVHYLLTLMMPQLGSRMNLRTQRELRTIMVALDLLAKKAPARAADILAQRVKALKGNLGGPLGDGPISGADTKRDLQPPGPRRGGLPFQGVSPDHEGDSLRSPQRRSRSGRPQRRERKRQSSRRRTRRKGEVQEEGQRDQLTHQAQPVAQSSWRKAGQ